MTTVTRFPASKDLEKALDLGERRFLPVIERLQSERLVAESRRQAAEAQVRKREKQRAQSKNRVDLYGRSAAICALVAALACAADKVVAVEILGMTTTVLFIASGTLCLSALASANAGLRAKIA